MKQIKILSILLHNFKGFKELEMSLDGQNSVILSGQNGYGKTTCFDALELLFTSEIKRMVTYAQGHDNRNSVSQEILPLVYGKSYSDSVEVKAKLLIDGKPITIFRRAKVSKMRNPVNFHAFGRLMLSETNNKERELTEEELREYGLLDLEKNYSFLHYLSQEEATAFLKKKEADRARDISELFNLQMYDIRLDKINKINKILNGKKLDVSKEINNVKDRISSLEKIAGNKISEVAYQRLCEQTQYWDVENPNISHEQFHSLLAENGLIDKLLYFVNNYTIFQQYLLNKDLDGIIANKKKVFSIAFMMKYGNMTEQLILYGKFKTLLVIPFSNLKLESLEDFSINLPDGLLCYIRKDDIVKFETFKTDLVKLYNSSTAIQKELSKLLFERQTLAQQIIENVRILPSNECPLCGNIYETKDLLIRNIENYDKVFGQHFSDSRDVLNRQFATLSDFIRTRFMGPIKTHFDEVGINEELFEKYSQIDETSAKMNMPTIEEKLHVFVSKEKSLEEIETELIRQLSAAIVALPDDVDFKALDNTYQSTARFIPQENLTVYKICNKRSYLQMIWNRLSSKELISLSKALDNLEKRSSAITGLKEDLKTLKNEVDQQRQSYFGGLLSDMKILFYIYSGRIMHTCYFGRGLFIKPDDKCKHIIFTSGNSDENDVDALYNMSSGQLVTLVISLLLSLNKLYGKSSILAIDDPVQTIDDINLWGLIETLRHDFNDHFMILSTHERDYRDLLEYKFHKWGIETKVVDMSSVDSKR